MRSSDQANLSQDIAAVLRGIERLLHSPLIQGIPTVWLTVDETAEVLKVSRDTIERLIASGQLMASIIRTPTGRGDRNRYRIHPNSIDSYLLSNRVNPDESRPVRHRSGQDFIE